MKRKINHYPPAYNTPEIVKNVFCDLQGFKENECSVVLLLSIGWNGHNYKTSTDWLIKTPEQNFAWPPSYRPQGVTFITMQADMKVSATQDHWTMARDHKTSVLITPDGQRHEFTAAQYVAIDIKEGSLKIPYSDCRVEVTETETERIYTILTDENTVYAEYGNGRLTLL